MSRVVVLDVVCAPVTVEIKLADLEVHGELNMDSVRDALVQYAAAVCEHTQLNLILQVSQAQLREISEELQAARGDEENAT